MKPGKVRATKVWPGNNETLETTLDWPVKVGDSLILGGENLGNIVALSFWAAPEKVFVHTKDASYRIEPPGTRKEG